MRLDEFVEAKPKKKRRNYMKIAREMAKTDKNMAIWMDIWDNGIKIKLSKKKKKNNNETSEIPKHDPYIKKQIIKAVKLRLENKVWGDRNGEEAQIQEDKS